jgi:hypothetical protein
MSAYNSVLSACPNVQNDLNQSFDKFSATLEPLKFQEAIQSPENTSNITQQISRDNGKTVDVEVRYFQPFPEAGVLENQPNPVCAGGATDPDTIATYTIDTSENVQEIRSFNNKDLERYCKDNPSYVADLIMRIVDAAERKNATKTAIQAAALIGKFATGVTVDGNDNLVVSTLQAGGLVVNPNYIGDINLALVKTNYVGAAMIFADSLLYRGYMNALVGCCTDSGFDLAAAFQSYGVATMWDYRIETAMAAAQTANTSLVMQPGSLALLHYTAGTWSAGMPSEFKIGSNYASIVVIGRTGTPVDINITDNCGTVTIAATITTKLVGLPVDMYDATSRFAGVTGVNSIKVTNP